jgi:hypothetical protein
MVGVGFAVVTMIGLHRSRPEINRSAIHIHRTCYIPVGPAEECIWAGSAYILPSNLNFAGNWKFQRVSDVGTFTGFYSYCHITACL